jgi:predicted nucleic acid-binding protein
MARIVCDSSSLVSLSDNCFLFLLEDLKDTEFLIPAGVKQEIIDKPITSKRFELSAIRLNRLVAQGRLKVFSDPDVLHYSKRITDLANSLLMYGNDYVKIMHEGEAETIGCLKVLKENALLIDERTTRQLIEGPDQLKKYMEARTGYNLKVNENSKRELEKELSGIRVIRSVELLAYAYEKGLLEKFGTNKILEAGLWSLKFSGCSMTDDEIREYVQMLL